MAVPIVVGDSWAENSADGFVEHCRKFDYFENLSDEALKCVYRVADMNHFGILVVKATDEIDPLNVDLENLSYMVRTYVDIDEFLAAINRIESINDYTYYLTKDYWTFVCISDSIFI